MNHTNGINLFVQALEAKSYLEIGVENKSHNFDRIVCPFKFGVDPDPLVKADFVGTSDQFFTQNTTFFDVVFIDGLHLSEQVLKDIDNSLLVLNPKGVILVHDCFPAYEYLQDRNRPRNEWTGDVWKTMLYLRRRPNLNITILDFDYGLGVIRVGQQTPLVVNNPTWDDFCKHKGTWFSVIGRWK